MDFFETMGSENDEAGLSEKHVEPVKSVPGEALINACATVEVSTPEPSVEAAQPLTASTQKESFELVGRATAGLLAAAYCSQDPKVIHKLAEALNLTGDPLLVGSEFADSPAEGRKNDITDSSTSTPQPEAEEESFVSSHDQELACNSSFCLQRVPLGSVLFSGSLTISQQGSLSVLGPGKNTHSLRICLRLLLFSQWLPCLPVSRLETAACQVMTAESSIKFGAGE